MSLDRYFVDGMLPRWVLARSIMVCSPKREVYKASLVLLIT